MFAAEFLENESSGGRFRRFKQSCLPVCGILAMSMAAIPLAAAQAAPTSPPSAAQTTRSQPPSAKKTKETPPPTPAPPVPAVAPSMFEQPATPATVTAGNNELTVKADNSSLAQILHQVSTKTGMHLDGLGGDERVFGSFGPAAPREVLTSLLNGTSYNVMMVGDLPNGAPRELLLTRRAGGGAATPPVNQAQNSSQNPNGQNGQNGDDAAQDDTGNGDDSSDDSPPMQYTPPSIAPAEPPPAETGPTTPQNPRVAPPMQSAPE
jgi:hypothetical protein